MRGRLCTERLNAADLRWSNCLVVIAIIALLLAIIIPAMRKVKMHAKRLVSKSNMRQIGIAVDLYAEDNRGFFPLTTHIENDEEKTWIYTLAPYLGDVDDVRIDPADPQGQVRLTHNTTSYIVNVYMNPLYELGQLVESESFHNLHRLKSPSQTITTFIAADDTPADDTYADHTAFAKLVSQRRCGIAMDGDHRRYSARPLQGQPVR